MKIDRKAEHYECNSCIHKNVCSYKDSYKMVVLNVDNCIEKLDNPVGTLDFLKSLPLMVRCSHYRISRMVTH